MRTRDESECNAHILQKKVPLSAGRTRYDLIWARVCPTFSNARQLLSTCAVVSRQIHFPLTLRAVRRWCTMYTQAKKTTYIRVFVFSGTLHLHLQRELWTPMKQNTSKRRRRLQELLSEGGGGKNTRKHGHTRGLFPGFFATRQWEYRLAFSSSTNSVFSSKNFHIV